jgi:hypothetical protein
VTASRYQQIAVDFLVSLRNARPVAFVGNKNVPRALLQALFGHQVLHIPTPPSDAYLHIDRLHAELLEHLAAQDLSGQVRAGAAVVVTFAGSTGLALQYRLREQNVFTFDFGSLLDALCEWETRGGMPAHEAATLTGASGARGSLPAWVFHSGFDRAHRRNLLRRFCEEIRLHSHPCAPELVRGDGLQDESVGFDDMRSDLTSIREGLVSMPEAALKLQDAHEAGAILGIEIVAPPAVLTRHTFNFSDPVLMQVVVHRDCEVQHVDIELDGFLVSPYLEAWPSDRASKETSQIKYALSRVPPHDGPILEGRHTLFVSVDCTCKPDRACTWQSPGAAGDDIEAEGTFELRALHEFEIRHVRHDFDCSNASQGLQDCIANMSLVPDGLAHVFEPLAARRCNSAYA